jgi:hypothetical protein
MPVFFIVGMLEHYSAKIWALVVEKLISPSSASRPEPFAMCRKCANYGRSGGSKKIILMVCNANIWRIVLGIG